MTTPAMTDQQLIDFSGEHLMHELSMLWETADELKKQKQGTTIYTALLESFALHLRSLIDFFYRPGKHDDVTAPDFLDAPAAWSPSEPPTLTTAHTRANKELSHLTQARKSGNPPEKAWHTDQILAQIATVARDFAGKASAKKLHPKVREFLQLPPDKALVWIGENVMHSNTAAYSLSLGAADPSTATVIVGSEDWLVPDPKK